MALRIAINGFGRIGRVVLKALRRDKGIEVVAINESIVDARCTRVIGDNMVKVISWYDNETGFSHRLIDLFHLIASKH